MRIASTLFGSILLSACATAAPPPPLPEPVLVDINSEEFQQQLARDHAAALSKAAQSQRNVARTFIVGWEMHHGYWFSPPGDPDKAVMPDFLDEKVLAQFDREFSQNNLSTHLGQRLVCECEGVAWSDYQPRFIVRKADLHWE